MSDRILLTRAEVADLLGVSAHWLRRGNGPKRTKLGPRTIRYHRADVEAYAEAMRGNPCSIDAAKSGGSSSSGAEPFIGSARARRIAERLESRRIGSRSKRRATLIVVRDEEPSPR